MNTLKTIALVAVSTLLLAVPAFAYTPLTKAILERTEAAEPVPAKYDYRKVGKPRGVAVSYVSPARLYRECSLVPKIPGTQLYSCAVVYTDKSWHIWVDQLVPAKFRGDLLVHEYAHVLGWRH